ncbi:MAG: glycosyl hydrolase family 65 protein [Thermogutta sp.]
MAELEREIKDRPERNIPNGFLAFDPQLPSSWSELSIDRSAFQDLLLQIRATQDWVEITTTRSCQEPVLLCFPTRYVATKWVTEPQGPLPKREENGRWRVFFSAGATLRIESARKD